MVVSAIKIVLILIGAPLFVFALAGSLEILLGAIGLAIAYRLNGQFLSKWHFKSQRIRQLVRDSWPLALASMAVMIYMKMDQIMLGQLHGNHEVGIYGAAVRFSEIWYFIPVAVVASVSPSLIEARSSDVILYYKLLATLFQLLVRAAFAIAIPMTFASGYLAKAFYGEGYEGVGPVVAIHIWSAPFVFLGVAQSPWTLNEGLTKLAPLRSVVGALANIALNLLLIPGYGAVGSAVATAVSYGLSAVVLNAFRGRTRRILYLQLRSMTLLPLKR